MLSYLLEPAFFFWSTMIAGKLATEQISSDVYVSLIGGKVSRNLTLLFLIDISLFLSIFMNFCSFGFNPCSSTIKSVYLTADFAIAWGCCLYNVSRLSTLLLPELGTSWGMFSWIDGVAIVAFRHFYDGISTKVFVLPMFGILFSLLSSILSKRFSTELPFFPMVPSSSMSLIPLGESLTLCDKVFCFAMYDEDQKRCSYWVSQRIRDII